MNCPMDVTAPLGRSLILTTLCGNYPHSFKFILGKLLVRRAFGYEVGCEIMLQSNQIKSVHRIYDSHVLFSFRRRIGF